jgi:hypothetical protein
MEDQVEKRGTVLKRNNVSKLSDAVRIRRLWSLNYARQISYEAVRKYNVSTANIQRWKEQKRNLRMPVVHDNYLVALNVVAFMNLRRRLYKFVWTVRQNGMPVLCDNITLKA